MGLLLPLLRLILFVGFMVMLRGSVPRMSDRVARVRVSLDFLAGLLLPEGSTIRAIVVESDPYRVVSLTVEHPDFDEVEEGMILPDRAVTAERVNLHYE